LAEDPNPDGKNEKFTDGIEPHWWPRVPPGKLRRLYENDALGIVDDDLIEDVGTSLFLRCQSILQATDAQIGRATCPRCGTVIRHTRDKAQRITCPGCVWQTTWGDYYKTIKGKGLLGGGSIPAIRAYVETYEHARSPRERFLLIDRLIHAFHWEMQQHMMSRPVACDLIAGRFEDVITLLDTLTYGERTTPEIQQEREAWGRKVDRSAEWFRKVLEESRSRRQRDRTGD
jgi:predicted RNA-binding Zn-ribbon protein involved in translation (DUF1610 family)